MRRVLTVVGLAVTLYSAAFAVVAAKTATADEIAAIDKHWGQAYVACDVKAWDDILAADLTFIHNNGSIDDKAKQIGSVKACPLESLNTSVTSVRFYGADTAVVLGRMQGKTKAGGYQFDLLYTRVYIQQNGKWHMVSHQSTDAPKKTS